MKTSDFNYELPKELIAQTPLEKRDTSRLMTLDRKTGAWEHHHFYELPDFLYPGDCLILNDSRVLPARLLGQRLPGGGACEVLLLIDRGEKTWECLVRPGRHMRQGIRLSFGTGSVTRCTSSACLSDESCRSSGTQIDMTSANPPRFCRNSSRFSTCALSRPA